MWCKPFPSSIPRDESFYSDAISALNDQGYSRTAIGLRCFLERNVDPWSRESILREAEILYNSMASKSSQIEAASLGAGTSFCNDAAISCGSFLTFSPQVRGLLDGLQSEHTPTLGLAPLLTPPHSRGSRALRNRPVLVRLWHTLLCLAASLPPLSSQPLQSPPVISLPSLNSLILRQVLLRCQRPPVRRVGYRHRQPRVAGRTRHRVHTRRRHPGRGVRHCLRLWYFSPPYVK